MVQIHVELLVEPFKENSPGPHVHAAVNALANAGLSPEMGPFSTTVTGDVDIVATAIKESITDSVKHGATAIQLRVEVTDG